MFNETSKKIKITATILLVLLAAVSFIAGVVLLVKYFDLPSDYRDAASGLLFGGLAAMIVGPFLAWTISLALYGEAVLIDNTNPTFKASDAYESETNLKIAKIKRLKKYLIQNVITEEEYNNEINKLKDL